MKWPKINSYWGWVLLLCLLVLSVTSSIKTIDEESSRLQQLSDSLRSLKELQLKTDTQTEKLLNTVPAQLPDPTTRFPREIGSQTLMFAPANVVDLPGGFRHHSREITVSKLKPERLSSVIVRLEGERSGWKVTTLKLTTSGAGLQGSLQIEALDKAPAEL